MIAKVFLFAGLAALTLGGCVTHRAAPPPTAAPAPAAFAPEVRVDERIELMAIIFRLAGAEEFSKRFVPAYADAIDAHFAHYRDHPAVLAAKELRATDSIGANAIPDLAVQLSPLPDLRERVRLEDAELDPRWKDDAARAFLAKARAFAIESNAAAFFAAQRPLYEVAERRMRNLIQNETDLRWIQTFYGGSGRERFVVAPGPGTGPIAYGSRFFGPDGEREYYAVMPVMQIDEDGRPAFGLGSAPVLVHEFGHSYVTPVILEHYEADLKRTGDLLVKQFGEQMRPLGYHEGSTIIHESIIRAGVAHYKRTHIGEAAARRELDRQRRLGFLWIEELYDLLRTFQQNRNAYPNFADFYPAIRTYFAGLEQRLPDMVAAYEIQRPRVVETSPLNGSVGVDPSTTKLMVRFDRPMGTGWGWKFNPKGAGEFPTLSGQSFDESRTVLTANMELKPNTAYEAAFLPSQFVSAEGVPMAEFILKFTTGPGKRRR
jgi:hypothetical protein